MDAAAIAAAMTPAQRQAVQAKLDVENRVKAEAERRASEQAAADRAAAEIHCQHLATIAAECQKAEAARAEEQRRAHISATWDAAIAANNASNASPARPLSVFGQAAANLRERYSKQKGA
jgi:UV DNA damage repair endonuclease